MFSDLNDNTSFYGDVKSLFFQEEDKKYLLYLLLKRISILYLNLLTPLQ